MNDYDERDAIERMLASERARPDQPPSALALSTRNGRWFYAWCNVCQRRLGVGENRVRAVAQGIADAHNESVHTEGRTR